MVQAFTTERHPILSIPSPEQGAAMGEDQWIKLMKKRDQIILEEKADPLRKGWEPPIWAVCDALLGFPWVDQQWAEDMRKHLKFPHPARVLLMNGGNRAGKSEYAAKRVMRVLASGPRRRAWCLHSKSQMSIDYQQPLLWKYMPIEWRHKMNSDVGYIAYKQKTGFSEDSFVLPNASDCRFFNYSMERDTIEGGNLDIIWPDELVPRDWVETMEIRIAEKNGWMINTFTPIEGYSQTVKMFQDAAETVQESIAYLCPADGGDMRPDLALGLDPDDPEEMVHPEDCNEWLKEDGQAQLPEPEDRKFERVPRVMRPSTITDPKGERAVIFIHSSDGPYGSPDKVVAKIAGKNMAFIRERFYGLGEKLHSVRFPKFDLKVHILDPKEIPADGTNYHIIDPASARNFFMLWGRVDQEGNKYIYREWPGRYDIPGVGVPGPWALESGDKPDGRPGPGQNSFGFGYWRYKKEIARLECWPDYLRGQPEDITEEQWILGMAEFPEQLNKLERLIQGPGAEATRSEAIFERLIDSRFASTPKIEKDRPVTMITEFEDVGLYFKATPGDNITEGIQQINSHLDYDAERKISSLNRPHLYISSECHNLIFAMQMWTWSDGNKGATKDPIDDLRYFLTADCIYVHPQQTGRAKTRGYY